jgi:hypothetical protein
MAGKAHVVQANRQKCRKHGIEKPNHFNQPLFSVSKVLGTYKYVVFFELLLRIFLSKILRRFISVNPAKHRRFSSRKPAMFISSLFPLREMRTATANLALPQASKSAFPTNKGLQAKRQTSNTRPAVLLLPGDLCVAQLWTQSRAIPDRGGVLR